MIAFDCCNRPSIANLDHKEGFEPEVVSMTNRVCLNCRKHWYGAKDGEIKEYTGKQWDEWIQQTFIEVSP